jgi:hypothetical protein
MLRLIGAVVLGYVIIGITVFAGLSALWLAIGPDRAFQPGVYDVSMTWVLLSVVVGFIAALAGGWVARRIERTPTGPRVLAAVVFVLGIVLALPALFAEAPASVMRDAGLSMFEAMQQAQTPVWVMLLNPVIGAIGVLVGGGAARSEGRAV